LTEQECRDAAREHGTSFGVITDGTMPKACVTAYEKRPSAQKPRAYYFNTHETGDMSYFAHPICKQKAFPMWYVDGIYQSNGICPSGTTHLTEQECHDSAAFEKRTLTEVIDRSDRPSGCFKDNWSAWRFNKNPHGSWSSGCTPVCGVKKAGNTCDEENWRFNNTNKVCGDCKVFVSRDVEYQYETCAGFCASIGRMCTQAWMAEASDTCQHSVKWSRATVKEKSSATWGHRKVCECGVQAMTSYKVLRKGAAVCDGELFAISESQCREAAEQFGFQFEQVVKHPHLPSGCTWAGVVRFNEAPNRKKGLDGWHPICAPAQAPTATCTSANGKNAAQGIFSYPNWWSKKESAEECKDFCSSGGCAVWIWHDDSTGGWAKRCVVWTQGAATANGRISPASWPTQDGITSGTCQAGN